MNSAMPAQFVSIDADFIDPSVLEEWIEWWRPYRAACWATHTSTPDAPRHRVIVELERPATRPEVTAAGKALVRAVEVRFGSTVKIDQCTLRPEQACFLPPLDSEIVVFDGKPAPVPADDLRAPTKGPGDGRGAYRGERKNAEEYSSHLSSFPLLSSVGGIPDHCVPRSLGERNGCLFRLARWARTALPTATTDELRMLVEAWHKLALPATDFAISWADFMRGHRLVKYPLGATVTKILAGYEDDALPAGIEALPYGPTTLRLVLICMRLAAHHQPEPFFLSARMAADLLGIHYTTANKLLSTLQIDGVLALIQLGAGNVASRYRLTWTEAPLGLAA
jgi:hypothetical protein